MSGDTPDDAALRNILERDYGYVRKLPDGVWVGLCPLIFTTALCVGLDATGYTRRYCYDDDALAIAEIGKLKSGAQEPKGWIARRPQLPPPD